MVSIILASPILVPARRCMQCGERVHVLLAASDHNTGIAQLHRLGTQRDGAQAGAADLVDHIGGALDRNAGADRCLGGPGSGPRRRSTPAPARPRRPLPPTPRPLQRGLDRNDAQIMGRNRAEAAIEGAHGRPSRSGDDDVGHDSLPIARRLIRRSGQPFFRPPTAAQQFNANHRMGVDAAQESSRV